MLLIPMQYDQSEALPRSGGDMHQFGIPALVYQSGFHLTVERDWFWFWFWFTTPFGWLVYLLWFWFYDSQVKTALDAISRETGVTVAKCYRLS